MGLIELVKVASAATKAWHGAPGQAVVITGTGAGGVSLEAEVYAPAGFLSRPPKDARGLYIPLGKSGVVIAGHNYKVSISLADGETGIFSTTADGATLKSSVLLKADGTIEINGNSKTLVTHAELNTALQTFLTGLKAAVAAGCQIGAGGLITAAAIDISSAATTTVKTGG